MGSIVTIGGFEIESNHESAEDMVKALTPEKPEGDKPKIVSDRGKRAEAKSAASEAASELGKLGGKAAAEARAKAKEAEPEPKKAKEAEFEPEDTKADKAEEKTEAKPREAKAEGEDKSAPKADEKKGDPRHDPKARIQQLAQERNEERARRQEVEQRLAALEAERKPKQPEAKPRRDQFETEDEFIEAAAEHRFREKEREAEERRRHTEHAGKVATYMESFRERVAEDPEFAAKVDPRILQLRPAFILGPDEKPGPLNVIAEALVRSDVALELAYHLTEHPEEMKRLIGLPSPVEIFHAVGRLEAKLVKDEPEAVTPEPERESHAPPPIKPLAPSSVPDKPDETGEHDLDTHMRIMGRKA